MISKLEDLATRQEILLRKIESQRNKLDEISQHFKIPLTVADTGIKAVKFIRNHPTLITAGTTAIITWKKSGFIGMVSQAWRALYLYPSILTYVSKYLHLSNQQSNESDTTDTKR